ncbi:MAG: hypothetical protein KJO40_19575 [Deltaproteobacteria bacterium]|nr:hypothetical protein [Deltaproteobacteria bacterium]
MYEDDEELTDDEIADVVDSLTEEDLRDRSHALNEAEGLYEEVAFLGVPKMPCPECAGAGQIVGGSLGDVCPRCFGRRVIDRPSADPIERPPFAELRARITAYGDALADRALPDGHQGRRNLALPPASDVPTMAEIQTIADKLKDQAKQLDARQLDGMQLAEPKKAKGMLGDGEEGLGDYNDAELDAMEEEDAP